jgi:hypothetical protein
LSRSRSLCFQEQLKYFSKKLLKFSDSNDNSGVPFASKRRGKRRIAFASQRLFPYHPPTLTAAEITSVNDVSDLPEKTFDINKEHLCVGCAKELQVGTLQGEFSFFISNSTNSKKQQ